MDLEISAENAQFLQDQVAAGSFPTPGAAVDAALEMLKRQAELRAKLQRGLDQLDRGEYIELDDEGLDKYFAELMAIGSGTMDP